MTLILGDLDNMTQGHTMPGDHPKMKHGTPFFSNHSIMAIFGHLMENQFPIIQMASNSLDTLPWPQQPMPNFWEFFWDAEDPGHFIEHLRCFWFSGKSILQSMESLWDFCLVVFLSSLRTQWWKLFSIWTPESPGTRRCRSRRALDARFGVT